jgi:RNA polymerase sigma-70 factor (ECF subfamily)
VEAGLVVQTGSIAPEELVRWCQRTLPGDTRGFEVLVRHYQQRVFATTFRLMGNQQDAEDMAQEVFLRIFRGIRDLKEPATLTSWIYRIATNTCLDRLEQEKRVRSTVSSLTNADHADDDLSAFGADPTPEEAAIEEEARSCIEGAIAGLEPVTRAVLVLRDVEERPYQEIADMLSLGLSALKMRIHRARLAFRRALEQRCPGVWRMVGVAVE